ncbi:MAG: hypothetical protein KGO22_06475 [Gammaproteobacteria bacterium]|nr:hypothetical protein [Gammaproteobacteria bacterium]
MALITVGAGLSAVGSAGDARSLAATRRNEGRGAAPVVAARRVPLGLPEKWDFLFYDADSGEAFVSHRTEITVVNPDRGVISGHVTGIGGSHGIVVVSSLRRGYADAAFTRTVVVFDSRTLRALKTIPVGEDPDAMVYDPRDRRVFVMDADGEAFTAIDAVKGVPLATVPLGGKPEFAAVDGAGKLFINIASKNEMVRVDARMLRVEARWALPGCQSPHGLAINAPEGRLFASCENGKLEVVTARGGRIVATLPIGMDSDAVTFDSKHKLVYSSNRDGTLSIIAERAPDEFVAKDPIHTPVGAGTMALDATTGRIFLVVSDRNCIAPSTGGGGPVGRVANHSGATLLVLAHPWKAAGRQVRLPCN